MARLKKLSIVYIAFMAASLILVGSTLAGKLYIKPELEVKRARRLLESAEDDFMHGKIHITFSPELSVMEFQACKEKYSQAIEIIEEYGSGYFTPGDVRDFRNRIEECDLWIQKSREAVKELEEKKTNY